MGYPTIEKRYGKVCQILAETKAELAQAIVERDEAQAALAESAEVAGCLTRERDRLAAALRLIEVFCRDHPISPAYKVLPLLPKK